MKKDILIKMPKKAAEEPEAPKRKKEVWPTMLPGDEPLYPETELHFFDGMTKLSGSDWIDVAELFNDYGNGDYKMSQRWNTTFECRDELPHIIVPKDSEIKIYCANKSNPDPNVYEDEYATSNTKRWERKPLLTMAYDWQQYGNRWICGGTYQIAVGGTQIRHDMSPHNVQAILKKSSDSDPYGIIDPSRYHEQEAKKLKMKWDYNVDDVRPLIYHGYTSGKYGLQVKDLSKTFAHYISGSLNYTYEWIDNLYWCPFDTTDTNFDRGDDEGKFKITKDPSYDAEEVSGLFLDGRKFEVFLMPRRIAYIVYYKHHVRSDTTVDKTISGVVEDDDCDVWMDSFFNYGSGIDDELIKAGYTSPGQIDDAHVIESTHYVGIMWGRIPSDFSCHFIGLEESPIYSGNELENIPNESEVSFYNSGNSLVGTVDLIWEETYEDARDHFVDSGESQEDADEIYSGGGSSFHVVRDSTSYFVRVGNQASLQTLDAVKNTMLMSPPDTRGLSNIYFGHTFDPDDAAYGRKRLWKVIEDSDYWKNLIDPMRQDAIDRDGVLQSSRIDMIPHGFALSPSKAGSLVAVIRTGGNTWFVWRATDEDFEDEGQRHTVGTSGKGHLSFQSRDSNGRLRHYREGEYEGASDLKYAWDADFADQFSSTEGSRKLDKVGREIDFAVAETHSA